MRLADALFRQGHLSERALADAIMTGERPLHLDQCDLCAERAADLGRSLDQIRDTVVDDADTRFPTERLAAQQAQIMRRLEQLDEPTRVIAFPSHQRVEPRRGARRLVAPGWIGVAAAAGLVIGVIGGQVTARVSQRTASAVTAESAAALASLAPSNAREPQVTVPINSSMLDMDLDTFTPEPLGAMNDITPRKVAWQVARQ